ncbi:MAG: hypothetical protein ABL914_04090 [Novosphingobium sp.]|uniref:hypothetical protein n=1 Tax=Novosphingobium sp. TaxID=1874826 RepID=UPI0032BABB68
MATQPPRRVLEPLAAPQHYMPPSARELRAQAVQRLQSGLFGIAAIILVVGLASIINDRALKAEAAGNPPALPSASASPVTGTDPLADVGVVPSSAPDPAVAATPQPAMARPAPAGQAN